MNRKEFISRLFGVAGVAGIASTSKCMVNSISKTYNDEVHEYAVKAASSYMRTYAIYPGCDYSGVYPSGMFHYKCDGELHTCVIKLPIDVRRSYSYSKTEVQDKLTNWCIHKCNELIDNYKGHTIKFDIPETLLRTLTGTQVVVDKSFIKLYIAIFSLTYA